MSFPRKTFTRPPVGRFRADPRPTAGQVRRGCHAGRLPVATTLREARLKPGRESAQAIAIPPLGPGGQGERNLRAIPAYNYGQQGAETLDRPGGHPGLARLLPRNEAIDVAAISARRDRGPPPPSRRRQVNVLVQWGDVASQPLILVALAGVLLLASLAIVVLLRRRRAARELDPAPPLIVFQPRPLAERPLRPENTLRPPETPADVVEPPAAGVDPRGVQHEPLPRAFEAAGSLELAHWQTGGTPPAPAADVTLQLLPGRLEPVSGGEEEIRFVRVPGSARFTFGRSPGPLHTHVQLHAATASRMHGYMEFEGGHWRIGNMSETNQVVVNGDELPIAGPGRLLKDGDRIEFGEVAFIFRER
jgi:hypothetical protein